VSAAWRVEAVALQVEEAHSADLTGPGSSRLVRVHRIARPTLVLGSTQPAEHVDATAALQAGVDVVRRRSGGGAVLLAPDDVVWVDVVVPSGDPLWVDDVGRAFEWLGDAWVRALGAVGVDGAEVHRGALVRSRWSDRVCFAGLGPGEVTVGGAKVVGISQRRTRHAARFQCAALLRWDVVGILRLLALPGGERAQAEVELFDRAAGVATTPEALVAAFVQALP
jgi:lipoate-protein ligase A